MNKQLISLLLLAAIVLMAVATVSAASGGTKRRGGQGATAGAPPAYVSENDDGVQESSGEVPVDELSYEETQEQQIATLSKEDQIAFYEDEVAWIQEHEVEPALRQLSQATAGWEQAKKAGGWFPNSQQKENIEITKQAYQRASKQLERSKQREMAVSNKIKPLYGIVSYQWMQEQRITIRTCLKQVNEMAYNQAWWQSMFNSRNESLTDVIVGFFVQWLVSYIIMYPFAAAYYLLWASPWSIYDYSSSSFDVVIGFVAWLGAALTILLPFAALIGGLVFIVRKYGAQFEARAQARQQQRQGAYGHAAAGAYRGGYQGAYRY